MLPVALYQSWNVDEEKKWRSMLLSELYQKRLVVFIIDEGIMSHIVSKNGKLLGIIVRAAVDIVMNLS